MAKLSQTHCSCPISNCKKAIHFPFSSTWTKDRQNEVTILANDYKKSWICSSLAQPDPTRHLWAVAVAGCVLDWGCSECEWLMIWEGECSDQSNSTESTATVGSEVKKLVTTLNGMYEYVSTIWISKFHHTLDEKISSWCCLYKTSQKFLWDSC